MTQPPSFGVRLAGLAVRMPAGTPLEYVAQATLHPLPLAPRRVAGLMQLRGQPLVVLDASADPENRRPAAAAREAHEVLVIGAPPNVAAVIVDGAPHPVRADAAALDVPIARVDVPARCPFFDAIVSRRVLAEGAEGEPWYDIDPSRLVAALLAD